MSVPISRGDNSPCRILAFDLMNRPWIPIQSKQTAFAHSKLFRTAVAWHHSFFTFCNHFIMKVSVSSACIIFHIPFRMSWHLQFQSFGWKRVFAAPFGMESLYSVYSTISGICSNSQLHFFYLNHLSLFILHQNIKNAC